MFHCFIDQSCFLSPQIIELKDDNFHHLIKVARVKTGEKITCHFEQKNYFGEVLKINLENAQVKVLKIEENSEILPCRVTLAQGLTKADKLEDIIQKCTEAGISEIIPVEMTRSVVKAADAGKKLERWQKIAKAASEQCGRSTMVKITAPLKLTDLELSPYDLVIVCNENEDNQTIKSVLKRFLPNLKAKSLLYIVGPEGGIDPKEADFLTQKGAISVTLGPRVYRTETAPIIFMAMLNYESL
jgi:16S rRNA (uracil1498-N3)-methyltransferase